MTVVHLGARLKIVRDKQAINEDREQRLELRRKVARKERKALQRADFLQRNVAWANRDAIELFYALAERLTRQTGIQHEVDHIVPLKGKKVSGRTACAQQLACCDKGREPIQIESLR